MPQNGERLQPGMEVRLIRNPLRIGTLMAGEPLLRRGRKLLQVKFPEGASREYEDQLEAVPEEPMHPLQLLADGRFGTPNDLRRVLTHVRLTGRLADIIYSMETTNTDFYAYQFKPVLKLLQTPTNSLLIADEVGLGKTIEAGLIWTELRSRFNLKRMVVLCPAALQEKWRYELTDKIGLSPRICDARETLQTLENRQAHLRGFVIISSMQGSRPPSDWDDPESEKGETGAARLARFLQGKESEERLIDLLVVDEAHHMRNPRTQTNRIGQLMRGVSDYLVLLSATPVHNRSRDLFSLLQLLDPDTFEREDDFADILQANKPLVRAQDLVLNPHSTAAALQSLLKEASANPILQGNRQLEMILAEINENMLRSRAQRSRIAYRLETVNLLGHAITRTRKRDVEEWRVIRDPIPEFISMTELERGLYDRATGVVIKYAQHHNLNERFLAVTPQHLLASCMPAALKSWADRYVEYPEDDFSSSDDNNDRKREIGPLISTLANHFNDFINLDALEKTDTKYGRLRKILIEIFKEKPGEKVVIFSAFRLTLDYLQRRLRNDNIQNVTLHGGSSLPKHEIVTKFQSQEGPNVLLSSGVGGEGIDLQFSRIIINYDLPWNPMEVEQRIGRLDRLGQESDKIFIWNLFFEDTVDARIYRCLYDKLDLCRTSLGDFEEIVGTEIRNLTIKLLFDGLSPAEQEKQIDLTAQALETRKQEEERLEAEASTLVAFGDHLLRQVQAAHIMHRWITGRDLFNYVMDFLKRYYSGYLLQEANSEDDEYYLSLTPQAKHEIMEFVQKENLAGQMGILQNRATPTLCRFENRVFSEDKSGREIISQFHPMVRFISARIPQLEPQIRPAVAARLAGAALDAAVGPGRYAVAVCRWSIEGFRSEEKLVYAAAPLDEPWTVLAESEAERLALACASHGERWLEASQVCDLDHAREVADCLFIALEDGFDRYVEEERAKNEDRATIQRRNLDRHVFRQRDTIQRTIERFRETGKTRLIPANEGRLRTLEERYERRKLEISSRRKVEPQSEEICVIIVEIR